jgi:ATP-dependent DNA helicase RecG
MDVFELRERIARWENLHTEFKEWPIHPDDLAAEIVAFANTDGGQLVLGVAKDRSVVGVDDPDKVAQFVDNVASNNCAPPVTVVQEVLAITDSAATQDSTEVVVVNVPKGDMRPYATNRGTHYIRTSSGRRHASREELLRLFQATESFWYDEHPLIRLSLDALNLEEVGRYRKDIDQLGLEVDERLLENWGLAAGGHPTIAGLVLFGREPQRHLPHACISAVRFPGTDSSAEPMDRKDLDGRLLDIVHQAEKFLELHLYTRHEIAAFQPERHPELPLEALREAVVNALAHRDYTVSGPIRLFVFDDRVEVHTPGKPPNTVDEGAMRAGAHVVRNPRIYARLADAGLATRAGSGVRRMVRLVREATGQDIGIAISEAEVVFVIPRVRSR